MRSPTAPFPCSSVCVKHHVYLPMYGGSPLLLLSVVFIVLLLLESGWQRRARRAHLQRGALDCLARRMFHHACLALDERERVPQLQQVVEALESIVGRGQLFGQPVVHRDGVRRGVGDDEEGDGGRDAGAQCDTNGRDGQLFMEEMATGWSDLCVGALLAQVSVADHQAPPPTNGAHKKNKKHR